MKPRRSIDRILAEEAEAFEVERRRPSKRPIGRPRLPEGEVAQVYSVRIPAERIEALRYRASEEGQAPSSLIREWVLERLDEARPHKRVTARHRPPAKRPAAAEKNRRR